MLSTNLRFISDAVDTYAGKTLVERATGRFYTPDVIGSQLAAGIVRHLEVSTNPRSKGRLSLCDPFVGDGRLLIAVLSAAAQSTVLRRRKFTVTACDLDPAAPGIAAAAIESAASTLGLSVEVHQHVGDSFLSDDLGHHDIVVTNPPWELLKPDPREVSHLNAAQADAYRSWMRNRCEELDRRFPDAKADMSWAGWGTNLARCGWDLAIRICRPQGVLGIVLPTTILADQASTSMRRAAYQRTSVLELSTYPAEARLFDKVDQPVVAAVFSVQPKGDGVDSILHIFDSEASLASTSRLQLSGTVFADRDYVLPVGFGAGAASLLNMFSDLPRFSDLEGDGPTNIWAGRELDESHLSEKLCKLGNFPFVKGRMVCRHGLVEQPTHSVRAELARHFSSTAFERLVWRDVARSSQCRRMIGTIIPPGWITGNSLHVVYYRDANPARLRALYGVVTSLVFEFQVRSRLATGHMSLGVVRSTKIPAMDNKAVRNLARHATRALEDPQKESALEVAAAKQFGVSREAFEEIVSQFPKITPNEREQLLHKDLWK